MISVEEVNTKDTKPEPKRKTTRRRKRLGGTADPEVTVPAYTKFESGAIYILKDQFGNEHEVQCICRSVDPRGNVSGLFHITGFIPEIVPEGSERGNMFKLKE